MKHAMWYLAKNITLALVFMVVSVAWSFFVQEMLYGTEALVFLFGEQT